MSKKPVLADCKPETVNEKPIANSNLKLTRTSNLKNLGDKQHVLTHEDRVKAGKNGIKAMKLKQLRESTQKKIDGYFDNCVQFIQPPTDSGLALTLEFDTSADFKRAARKGSGDPCQDLYAKARLKIENYYETQLAISRNATGPIFKLKNLNNDGWQDVQEVKTETKQEIDLSISSALKDIVKEIVNDKY